MRSGAARTAVGSPGSLSAGLLLAIVSLSAALLLVEGGLRLEHFQYHLMPAVQFGWPDPQTIRTTYADDPDVFWVTRDYRDKLRAARHTHPAVIFMGDSCTEFGQYPERTIQLLSAAHAPVATGLHLAAGGWSSEQGLVQLERDVIPLHPKVVVIYYGWNDHWMALGPTDEDLHAAHRFLWLADHVRLVQLVLRARMGLALRGAHPYRVPPDRYRHNIETMARLAQARGIVPIFVTAPSNYVAGQEPAYLLQRHVARLADVIPLHQRYVQITREAAHAAGGVVCDAAATFDALPPPHDMYFKADAIHFTAAGDEELARVVSGCVIRAAGTHAG